MKIDLARREQVDGEKMRVERSRRGVITVGMTMSWPSREDARTTDRRTQQVLRWLTFVPMVTFPDTFGGKQGALHQYQLHDTGKLNIR